VLRRTGKLFDRPNTLTVPLQNCFDKLCESESDDRRRQDLASGGMLPPFKNLFPTVKPSPSLSSKMREVSFAKTKCNRRVWVQPYGGSYFLPGKIAGKAGPFLQNSACTTNLLGRQLFDTPSAKDKAGLKPYDGEHSTLTGQVRNQTVQETFIVSQLKEDAIFQMPFLMRHDCHIDFSKSAVVMAG